MCGITLALVPACAGKCRLVRGFLVGNHRRRPGLVGILWGTQPAQEPVTPEDAGRVRRGRPLSTWAASARPAWLRSPAARVGRYGDRHRK